MKAFLVASALAALGCGEKNVQMNPIHCTSAADCPANLPMCTLDSQICVGCTSDFQTCGPNKTCDDATHTCIPAAPDAGCKRNADCPRPGVDPPSAFVCEVDAGQCYPCVTNDDCPVGTCKPNHTCDFGYDMAAPPDASATD